MNVRKILAALLLMLLASFAQADVMTMKGVETCSTLNAINIDSEQVNTAYTKPYICDQDIAAWLLISVFQIQEIPLMKSLLKNLGMSESYLSDDPNFSVMKLINFVYLNLFFPLFVLLTAYSFIKSLLKISQNGKRENVLLLMPQAARTVVGIGALLGGVYVIFFPLVYGIAYANSIALNADVDKANADAEKLQVSSQQVASNNISANAIAEMALTEFRTKQAIMYVNAANLASTSWGGIFDSLKSKETILSEYEKTGGYQFSANTDSTFEFEFGLKAYLGGLVYQGWNWYNSEEFATAFVWSKKQPGLLEFKNKFGQPSVLGSAVINNSPNAELVDPRTDDANGQELKKIFARAAQSASAGGALLNARIGSIRDRIKPSLIAGNDGYLTNDYSDIKNEIKQAMKSGYAAQENAIKELTKLTAARIEIGSKAFGTMNAAQKGFDLQKGFADFYNGEVMTKMTTDFWNVDCSRFFKEQEQQRKFSSKLNGYGGRWADAESIWSQMTWKCAYVSNGQIKNLGFDPESQKDQIQEAFADAKATRIAIATYFNLVDAASAEAVQESLSQSKTAYNEMMKQNLYGFVAMASKLSRLADINSQYQKMISGLSNSITVNLETAIEGNNYFIDPIAVFSDGKDEDHGDESKKQIAQLYKVYDYPLAAPFFGAGAGMKNGNLTQLKNSQVASGMGFVEEKVYEYFESALLGDVGKWLKMTAQLDSEKSIANGLAECAATPMVCDARARVSAYEASVSGGRILFESAFQGYVVIKTLDALAGVTDSLGEGVKAVGGSVGSKASGLVKAIGGGTFKTVTALVKGVADSLSPLMLLLMTAGLTAGYIMPLLPTVAALVFAVTLVLEIFLLLMVIPLGILIDTINDDAKYLKKSAFKALLLGFAPLVWSVGFFIIFLILTQIPVSSMIRLAMSSSPVASGILSLVIPPLVAVLIIVAIYNRVIPFASELVEKFFVWFDVKFDVKESAATSKIAAAAQAGVAAQMIANISTLPAASFKKIEDEILKRRMAEARDNAQEKSEMKVEIEDPISSPLWNSQGEKYENKDPLENSDDTKKRDN